MPLGIALEFLRYQLRKCRESTWLGLRVWLAYTTRIAAGKLTKVVALTVTNDDLITSYAVRMFWGIVGKMPEWSRIGPF